MAFANIPERKIPTRASNRRQGLFLRGPIPLDWLSVAVRLPGKTGQVALVIWWRAGIERRRTGLRITTAHAMRFGVDSRRCRKEALRRLEKAGLIRVTWQPNKAPLADLLKVEGGRLP